MNLFLIATQSDLSKKEFVQIISSNFLHLRMSLFQVFNPVNNTISCPYCFLSLSSISSTSPTPHSFSEHIQTYGTPCRLLLTHLFYFPITKSFLLVPQYFILTYQDAVFNPFCVKCPFILYFIVIICFTISPGRIINS